MKCIDATIYSNKEKYIKKKFIEKIAGCFSDAFHSIIKFLLMSWKDFQFRIHTHSIFIEFQFSLTSWFDISLLKDEKPTTTTMMVQNFWHGVAVLMWCHITSRHIGRWQWHRRLGSHNGLRNHERASASCCCLKPKRISDFQFHTSHFANRCFSNARKGSRN